MIKIIAFEVIPHMKVLLGKKMRKHHQKSESSNSFEHAPPTHAQVPAGVPSWLMHVPNEYRHALTQAMIGTQRMQAPLYLLGAQSMHAQVPHPCGHAVMNDASADMSPFGKSALYRQYSRHSPSPSPSPSSTDRNHSPAHDEIPPREHSPSDVLKFDSPAGPAAICDGAADDVGDMEKQFLQAYKDRSDKKKDDKAKAKAEAKTKAKAEAKATTKATKRPAEDAMGSVCKKPAAHVLKKPAGCGAVDIDMEDVFDELAQCGELPQNTFTSRAYDRAKRRAAKAGFPDEVCKEFAREQFKRASELYSSL